MPASRINIERELVIRRPGEQDGKAVLRIRGITEKEPGMFGCAFWIDGLDVPERTFFGADELQALLFCLYAAYQEITFHAKAGIHIEWDGSDHLAGFSIRPVGDGEDQARAGNS